MSILTRVSFLSAERSTALLYWSMQEVVGASVSTVMEG